MLIGGVPFDRASGIDLTRGPDGQPGLAWPGRDDPNPRGRELHEYGYGPFSDLVLSNLPHRPGVYAIRDDVGRIRYIGKADGSIAYRWGSNGYGHINGTNCFKRGQSTNCRINGLIVESIMAGASLSLYTHITSDPIPLEGRLIRTLRPPWNKRTPFDPALVDEYINKRQRRTSAARPGIRVRAVLLVA